MRFISTFVIGKVAIWVFEKNSTANKLKNWSKFFKRPNPAINKFTKLHSFTKINQWDNTQEVLLWFETSKINKTMHSLALTL